MKDFFKNSGILMVLISMATLGGLTSCCTSICDGKAPALRPIPDSRSQDMLPCGVYVIEDIIEIPVTPSGK